MTMRMLSRVEPRIPLGVCMAIVELATSGWIIVVIGSQGVQVSAPDAVRNSPETANRLESLGMRRTISGYYVYP